MIESVEVSCNILYTLHAQIKKQNKLLQVSQNYIKKKPNPISYMFTKLAIKTILPAGEFRKFNINHM